MNHLRSFFFLTILSSFVTIFSFGQSVAPLKWYDPSMAPFPVVTGRGWHSEMAGPYDRLPARSQPLVRVPLWNLSKNSAGLSVRFKTSSNKITVRYKVAGNQAMSHMPATGVSGVDLYARDIHGEFQWARAGFSFGDTIVYRYSNLSLSAKEEEFTLYLPLYNTVTWMEIGVPESASFHFLPLSTEKPIVTYGTSIMQGACATRPGLAWTNILERKLDRTVINIGFSGNGQLEPALIDLMNEIDAKMYVLDCMPNLVDFTKFPKQEIETRIRRSVGSLQEKHPGIPILLVEHSCGLSGSNMDSLLNKMYKASSDLIAEVFSKMLKEGVQNIYLLTDEAIGFNEESTVDGTHPNDIGMMQYAEAYEKIIRAIFKEETGVLRTTRPIRQRRDNATYDFMNRHKEVLRTVKAEQPKVILIGNSITHFWGGKPESGINRGVASWNKYWAPRHTVNLGYGWDRIENVLWRVYHGELDGYKAEKIYINIGTNNLSINDSDEDIIAGLRHLINAIRQRQPEAQIILSGIYPRRKMEERIVVLNKKIEALTKEIHCLFADPGTKLLGSDKKINEKLFSDGLHPNAEGYELLGHSIQRYF